MKTISTFFFLTLLFFIAFNSNAQQPQGNEFFVVPSDYTSTAGNVTFLGPLYTGSRTYQLLIHEDLLTTIVGKEIKALSWRLPTSATSPWPAADVTVTEYNLFLSGSVPPASRDLTNFASHVVGTQVQVKSGSLLIPANSYPSGSSPNDWGTEITFDNVYHYTGGHMLVELRLTGTGNSRSTDALNTSTSGYGTLFSACWGSSNTANSGSQGNFSIVRFTADDPVPVELTSFNVSSSGKSIHLNWSTASEINNYGFEVERKSAESDFEAVGFVPGFGSTTEKRDYSFVDSKVTNNTYTYRLKQIDFDGSFEYSHEVELDFSTPDVYSLEQNYPNPFNPSTKIVFNLAEAGLVKLTVYNLLGQEVINLVNENMEAGNHSVEFNASSLTSGVYFYKLETPQFSQTRKMILSK